MDKPWDLRERTMRFAVAVFDFCRQCQRSQEEREPSTQLRGAAASVASHYRAAQRARSGRDFASKIGVAIEEADEADFWLEYMKRVKLVDGSRTADLQDEANELVSILTACQKTKRRNLAQNRLQQRRVD